MKDHFLWSQNWFQSSIGLLLPLLEELRRQVFLILMTTPVVVFFILALKPPIDPSHLLTIGYFYFKEFWSPERDFPGRCSLVLALELPFMDGFQQEPRLNSTSESEKIGNENPTSLAESKP